MVFLFSLIPATTLVVIGYFVLFYSSGRAEGALSRFGQYLAIWVFFFAGVVVLGGLLAPILGNRGPMGA